MPLDPREWLGDDGELRFPLPVDAPVDTSSAIIGFAITIVLLMMGFMLLILTAPG